MIGNVTVAQAGLKNGDMIFIQVDEEISGIHEQSQAGKFITKDGNIVALEYTDSTNKTGFRPGMMALRDIKKQWTLREFESLDSQFVYKIKKADQPVCKIVSLDQASLDNFQLYQRNFNFQRIRFRIESFFPLTLLTAILLPGWGIYMENFWKIILFKLSSSTSLLKILTRPHLLSFQMTIR